MLIKNLSMCISGIERNVIILRVPVQIWVNRLNSSRPRKKTGWGKKKKKKKRTKATTSKQNARLSKEVMDLRVSQFAASMFHQFFIHTRSVLIRFADLIRRYASLKGSSFFCTSSNVTRNDSLKWITKKNDAALTHDRQTSR